MRSYSWDEVLEELRGRIGYKRSQSELAEKLGVSKSFVCEILAGRKRPSEEMLHALGYRTVYLKRKRNGD